VTGPSTVLDGLALAGELRRQKGHDGTTSIVVHGGGELDRLAQREPALRVEALSLEDLFIEVTQ
jgi:ABC-2 type transport system ATP-binding protein